MSDDEADPELLALLRKSLGLGGGAANPRAAETKVLENAQFVYDNAIDVALNSTKTKDAAEMIWRAMQKKEYSTHNWSEHELHPKTKDESTIDFIFTMDLLNFSFWSDETDESKRFAVEYRGKRWTGYWSLVAALQRALDEGIQITDPVYWVDEDICTDDVLKHVFRTDSEEEFPMLQERIQCLREAGRVLCKDFDGSFANCIYNAHYSAASLVNLLAENFPCFRDETSFQGRRVRLYKRAQILVADLWACFNGEGYGAFQDIDKITMFAGMLLIFTVHRYVETDKYRLPNPTDPLSFRMSNVLPSPGKPHPKPQTHPQRLQLGNRTSRRQHLVRRADQTRDRTTPPRSKIHEAPTTATTTTITTCNNTRITIIPPRPRIRTAPESIHRYECHYGREEMHDAETLEAEEYPRAARFGRQCHLDRFLSL